MTALQRAKGFVFWLAESFGPLVVFYACLHLFGLVPAIVSGIACGALLVANGILRDKRVSPFTAFIAANVVVFGFLDLRYQTGFFVKLEPAFGNVAVGLFFLFSVALKRPILIEFAERASGRSLERAYGYLRAWTVVWALFFFLRAAGHVWLAYTATLDQALAARAVLGPLSFVAMFAIEMPIRFLVYGARAFQKAGGAAAQQSLPATSVSQLPSS
jgi:intracellular septation protein A